MLVLCLPTVLDRTRRWLRWTLAAPQRPSAQLWAGVPFEWAFNVCWTAAKAVGSCVIPRMRLRLRTCACPVGLLHRDRRPSAPTCTRGPSWELQLGFYSFTAFILAQPPSLRSPASSSTLYRLRPYRSKDQARRSERRWEGAPGRPARSGSRTLDRTRSTRVINIS